jgi:hypothetical protein
LNKIENNQQIRWFPKTRIGKPTITFKLSQIHISFSATSESTVDEDIFTITKQKDKK